jgi:hypothetical protein
LRLQSPVLRVPLVDAGSPLTIGGQQRFPVSRKGSLLKVSRPDLLANVPILRPMPEVYRAVVVD